ncbi:MAG TPA: SDR family NAD(P)-dependent oxidoreductase [Myxococcota bacterium]|nr:SDR family NAD(P)-dependent oxidoreductase [Myxococcota bacterium]
MANETKPCAGKVAFVTGASRGIGAAIAERLAAAGAAVAVTARSVDSHPEHLPGTVRETAERIEARGGRALPIHCDVFDPESCAAAVAQCREALGPIDVLVNNAAAGPYRPFEQLSLRDFEVTFTANVRAPLVLAQLVAPDMRARGRGWIVNVSSASAELPQGPPYGPWETKGGMHLYAASKAALNRLTVGLAAELQPDGIAVNALAPVAAVLTPGVEALGATRWIDPSMTEPIEAIAEATLALATCDASLTGRVAYSLPLLRELGREVRTLDGASPVAL